MDDQKKELFDSTPPQQIQTHNVPTDDLENTNKIFDKVIKFFEETMKNGRAELTLGGKV